MGLALAGYHRFYHMDHVLVLGRVLSGEGGEIIRVLAESALARIDPDLSERVTLHLPDEASRRVGQSIAAAASVTSSGHFSRVFACEDSLMALTAS